MGTMNPIAGPAYRRKRTRQLAESLAPLPPASPRQLLHSEEEITCPIIAGADNYHFEGHCEDCDAKYLSRCSLGEIEDRYHVGRISQDQFEAYSYLWALLSPTGSRPEWRATPEDQTVRRIARKLLRVRGFDIPAELTADGGAQAVTR